MSNYEEIRNVKKPDVNAYTNVTHKYNMTETYNAFSNYTGFQGLPQNLKSQLQDYPKEKLTELNNITSKDQIISLALEMLGKIDARLKTLAQNVLTNAYVDTSRISLDTNNDGLSSTSKCFKDADKKINVEINAKRDASGVMAVAQTLVDAGLLYECDQKENEKDQKKATLARNAAKKFIGYAMIDTMAREPYMNISPAQKDTLINENLREDFSNINSMEEDIEIFEEFINKNEELFADPENIDNEALSRALQRGFDNPANPEIQEKLDRRTKEIAEKNKTPTYIIGEALETMVALQTLQNVKETPEADPIKKLMQGAINGYAVQDITGKTPQELADCSPELINKLEKGELEALPESMKEQEVVMEMLKHKNNQ